MLRTFVVTANGIILVDMRNVAGSVAGLIFKSPNQLVRYEIRSDGTNTTKRIGYFSSNAVAPYDSNKDGVWLESVSVATTGSMTYVCSQVSTEGSMYESGKMQSVHTGHVGINFATIGTTYPLKGIRLATTFRDRYVKVSGVSGFVNSNNDILLLTLQLSPTLLAPLTYAPNIRTAFQTYENCYIIGPNEPIAIANKDQGNAFETDYPVDGTSYFRYCIVENGATAGISFFNTENLAEPVTTTTVRLHGIIAINCADGITFGNGVRNVNPTGCLFIRSTANEARQTNGTGNKLTNCTFIDSVGFDVNVASGSMTAVNSIIPTKTGTLVETTCSTNVATFVDAINDNYRLAEGTYQAGVFGLD